MKKWRLDRDVIRAHGVIAMECMAETKEDAFENFKKGNCSVVDKEFDVAECAAIYISDIRQIES
jgi:hypothetical protein